MNIYSVHSSIANGLDKFDEIGASPSLPPEEQFVGLAKGSGWKPPALRRHPRPEGRADVYQFAAGAMLLSSKALHLLSPILASTTNFEMIVLPPFEGEELTLVHVVGLSDECLDAERIVFDSKSRVLRQYAFLEEHVPRSLFKVEPTCNVSTLVPERTGDRTSEFRAAVLHHDLEGISFAPIQITDYRVAGCGDYPADAAEYELRGTVAFPLPENPIPTSKGPVRVYRVLGGGREFQRLQPLKWRADLSGFFKAMFRGEPRATTWRPEPVFLNPRRRGSFDLNEFRPGTLALTPKAVEFLRPVFKLGGAELLPQPHCGTLYRILNVTNVASCLDMQRTKFRDPGIPTEHAFIPEQVPLGLFKIRPTASGDILVPERTGDPGTEFKAAVEHYGLRGVKFELLWEG